MSDRMQLVGGPLDGHEVGPPPGKYVWVRGKLTRTLYNQLAHAAGKPLLKLLPGARATFVRGGAATCKPLDGAALYQRDGDVLVYAGHRVTLCNACGCYHGKAEGGREKRRCALGGDDAAR